MNKVYSFDVFDTIISRACDSPKAVFACMEQRIQELYQKEYFGEDIWFDFYNIRLMAELILINRYDKTNGVFDKYTLDDIYEQIRETQNLSAENINKLKQLELEMEEELSVPINDTISIVEKLINENKRVILISDMYLPSEFIRKLLLKQSKKFENVPLYVSCEYGMQKSTGLLFNKIKEIEAADYHNWEHFGDNCFSDCLIPQAFGIKVRLFDNMDINVVKQKGDSLERIQKIVGRAYKNTSENIGYRFGGAVLLPYVIWFIDIAKRNEIDDIYFIARDGYVLKQIADIIIEKESFELSTHYIYGSRKAWTVDEKNKRNIGAYLCQEIDFCKKNLFVDLQGRGMSLETAFDALQIDGYTRQLCAFYDKAGPYIGNRCRFLSFSDNKGTTYIESMARAPHGETLFYFFDDNTQRMVPALASGDKTYFDNISDCVEGTKEFVENYYSLFMNRNKKQLVEISRLALNELNSCDELDLMEYIYDMPFEVDEDGNDILYAPKLSHEDVEKYLNENIIDERSWYRGINIVDSIKRCDNDTREIIRIRRDSVLSKAVKKESKSNDIRIVVYGAGKNGQDNVYKLYNTQGVCVVLWVDIDYEKAVSKGLPVSSINTINDTEFDYVLLSIIDDRVRKGAKCILENQGVDNNKILSKEELIDIIKCKKDDC